MKITIAIIGIILCSLTHVQAQVNYLGRYESQNDFVYFDYLVIPNGQMGVSIVKSVAPRLGKEFSIQFIHLDNNLTEQWNTYIKVPEGFNLKEHQFLDDTVYLLFQSRDYNRSIKVIAINIADRKAVESERLKIIGLDLAAFEVVQKTMIIGGYINDRPTAFIYDLQHEKVQILPNLYRNNSELLDIHTDPESSTFSVVVSRIDQKRDRTIVVNRYDHTGVPLGNHELKTKVHYQLLSAVSSSFKNGYQIVTGLFSVKKGTYPSGIYIGRIDRVGGQTMKYVRFEEFDTFIDFLGEKRSQRIRDKTINVRQNGRIRRYETDALLRSIREENGQLIITGEFFEPWSKNTNTYQRERDRLHPRSYYYDLERYIWAIDQTHNLGYNSFLYKRWFTHAFSFAMDSNGELLWDASFDINKFAGGPLSRFGEFLWHGNTPYYLLHRNKNLVFKNLRDNERKNGLAVPLDELYSDGDIQYGKDHAQHILKWSGNKFLIYGIEYTYPPDDPSKLKAVFFINAVSIGPDLNALKLD